MKKQVICKQCSNSFEIEKSREKHGRGIYCSVKCKNKGILKKEIRQCPVCKSEFEVNKSSKKRFCSPNCSYKARSIGLVKRKVIKPYKISVKIAEWKMKKCIICNANFIAKKRTQKHCSKNCYRITQSKRISGSNNYFYLNGNSKNKKCYRGDNWAIIRKSIYKRDNWTCRLCNKHCDKKEIQCHHIQPYKKGGSNEEYNLVTLCNVCHPKVEQDIKNFNHNFFNK